MTRRRWIALGVGAAALLLGLVAWFLPGWLSLEGWAVWVLRGGLWLLLLVAAFLLLRLLLPSGNEPEDDGIRLAFRGATARLRASGRGGPSALPTALVLGPSGSTKTTLILNSGLEPELLSGEVQRGDTVVPTDGINLWLAGETLWVEAGGGLTADPGRWPSLVRRLRPSRMKAALTGKGQAPRAAVVCFDSEILLQPGAAEVVPAYARELRDRLTRMASSLGIRLPVYAVFTRADRIPHFTEFVRSLAGGEPHQVLGATLPVEAESSEGTWAQRESARITSAFQKLYRSLAEWRLPILAREAPGGRSAAGAAYEFPREIRKISALATGFLVDLVRPSQLGASPFLRGFYFVGVRPVVVEEQAAPSPAGMPSEPGGMGATRVFNLQDLQAFQEAPRAAAPGGSRRVPQWVFLQRLFPGVILRDEVARGITAGGAGVNLVRRVLLGTAAALALVLAVGFSVSFLGNRALQAEARVALEGVRGLDSPEPELPTEGDLQRLDALRDLGARLRVYGEDAPPRRLRWGLYGGGRLLEPVRTGYFAAFDRLLLATTRQLLSAELLSLPEAPAEAAEYGRTYDALKGYLIAGGHPDRSTDAFLTPVLLDRWLRGRDPGAERMELLRRQFAFYATELPHGDPYSVVAGADAVERGRSYLAQFTGVDPFYQALLTEAGRDGAPVDFAREFPGSEAVLRNPFQVPAAFTAQGWEAMEEALDNVDVLLAGENWVVGEQRALTAQERAELAAEIRRRYVADYVDQWERFLAAAAYTGFAAPQDAAGKLARLSGNQSPVLQLLALASRNTDVDTLEVARAFQPVHQVTPPEIRDRFVGQSNQPYVVALGDIGAALDRVASAAGDPAPLTQAQAGVDDARGAIQQITREFSAVGEAQGVARAVERLLEDPVRAAEALVRRAPAADLNAAGVSFCGQFNAVVSRYPFNRSGADAEVADVAAVFEPGSSLLWSFHQETLEGVLVRQGPRYAPRPGAPGGVNPAFLEFFNRAVLVTRAFYQDEGRGAAEPSFTFVLRVQPSEALPEVTVNVDGQSRTFTRTSAPSQPYVWNGARASDVRVTGLVDGNQVQLLQVPSGPWAVFRFLEQATWRPAGAGGRFTLEWSIPGVGAPLVADLTAGDAALILQPGALQGLTCVSRIAR